MTSIATIANDIGIADRPGERAVTMAVVGGRVRHAYLTDAIAAGVAVDDDAFEALYLAGGLFRDGSLQGNSGRSQANLTRVLWLPFDADLLDWYGAPKKGDERERLLAELGETPQAELDAQIALLRAALEETFAALRIPIHRLDYTGYGLCAYVYVAEADQTRIDDCRAAHARLVAAVNQRYGAALVDDQVKDAGTRVTRVPGSYNRKGRVPRLVTTLIPWDGSTAPLGANPDAPRPVAHMIPSSGPGMTATDIEQFVAAVAPSWSLGQKHAMALATAALLAKARIPEAQATAIVERLAADDAKPWDRKAAVVSTYNRMRAGEAIAGYSALVGMMPAATVAFVDQLLGKYRNATSGAVGIGELTVVGTAPLRLMDKQAPKPAIPDVPEACYAGWFKGYVDLVEPLCESPRSFHLASAMVLAGASFGRSVCTRYVSKNVYGNTYMMLIGLAGSSRKDTAIDFALDFPNHRGPGYSAFEGHGPTYKLVTDVGSGQAMIKTLSQTPNVLLHVTEYQRVAQNAKREGSTIFPLLTAAWNTPRVVENNSLGNPLEAKYPYLSILAAVQPGILAQEMRQADIESGYATRWLYVVGEGKNEAIPDPDEIDEAAAWRLYKELLTIRQRYEAEAEGSGREKRLLMTPAARDRWHDWYRADRQAGRLAANEDEASMRSRLGTHVRKVALLYAATTGANAIDVAHLEPAMAFVEWSWAGTQLLMRDWGVSVWIQIENKIEKVLRSHGAIMRKDLAYKCRSRLWSAREFAQVLDAMIKNGTVELDSIGILKWAA